MNSSSAGSNGTVVVMYRDSFTVAVTKNAIVVALGISINYINASLIYTFRKHQIFSTNPRYILFIHLVVNDMIQMTIAVLLFLISYALYTVNVSICSFFILLAVCTTENTPLNLACMAVECYIAICLPLRHVQICTVKRTYVLIGLIWTTTAISVLPDVFVALATEPLDFFYSSVFCIRETVFRSPHTMKKRDVSYAVYLVIVWLTIFYTYFRILFAANAASSDAKKARNTILLHGFQLMLCMLTYIHPLLRAATVVLPRTIYVNSLFVFYVVIQILPRFISPILYGLRDKAFRKYLKGHLLCQMSMRTNPGTVKACS